MNCLSSKEKKNIVVTGGSGFIGRTLISKLLVNKSFNLFNVDKLGYASDEKNIQKEIQKLGKEYIERYKLFEVDLYSFEKTNNIIIESDPDIVFHLAAESHVDRSIDNPSIFLKSNIVGTFNLLQSTLMHYKCLSNERKRNFRFVHISTDEVFGSLGPSGFFNERTPYDPRSPYSASKASSDHLVSAWNETYDLPTIITNCSNNYGPWQFIEKLIPTIIIKAINGEKIPIYGDGSNIRDWLYVEDHIDAIILAGKKGKSGESYCIGGKEEKSNLEMVTYICEVLDRKNPKPNSYRELITFVDDRPGHDKRYAIDSSKIRKELGWEPKYSFAEGIENTIDWYLNNLEWCDLISQQSKYAGNRLGLLDT